MKVQQLLAATDAEVIAEYRRVAGIEPERTIRLIDRSKITFLFAHDDIVEEQDKSWIDTSYRKAYVSLDGTWHVSFAKFYGTHQVK